jgi:protein-disulfide isomerase
MKNPWLIFGGIIALLFVGAFYIASTAGEANNEGIEEMTHVKGNPDAEVVLVEYSDFQCPACQAIYPIVSELMAEFGDSIRFEYKHFPIERSHPYAVQAATAAEAAGQQGKFYEFHDLLFDNQQAWGQSPTPTAFFQQYAEELGLDVDTFKRHANASVLRDKVRGQQQEGLAAGVTGTPTVFLNGERMVYATYDEFISQVLTAIDPALTPQPQSEDPEVVGEATGESVRFGI